MPDPTDVPPADVGTRWPAVVTIVAIGTWPFAALLAVNAGQPLDHGAVAIWWVSTLAVTGLVTAFALRRSRAAGRHVAAWLAVVVWLTFSFPLVSGWAKPLGWDGNPVAWWAVVAAVVATVAFVVTRATASQQFVLIVAVLLAVGAIGQRAVAAATEPAPDQSPIPEPDGGTFTSRPDVWFFVLDGLASDDWIRGRTGYDASAFEAHLEGNGFAIQRAATSNYPLTHLSISSTLEMDYGFRGFEESKARIFFERLRGDNATVDLMQANGYSYVHVFPGFWGGSRCGGREDLCLGRGGAVTDTDAGLRAMVPFGAWLDSRVKPADIADANDPGQVTERIIAADVPGPTYHFVHMLNPHPPLLRDASCGLRRGIPLKFSLWGDGQEYGDEVACLHQQLMRAVDLIQARDRDAIIVIQGDHGPRLGIDWSVPGGVTLDQEMHFSIFSAMRLPDTCNRIDVPDDLTSVNTFRIVRACLEGTEPQLLEDERFPIHATRR